MVWKQRKRITERKCRRISEGNKMNCPICKGNDCGSNLYDFMEDYGSDKDHITGVIKDEDCKLHRWKHRLH